MTNRGNFLEFLVFLKVNPNFCAIEKNLTKSFTGSVFATLICSFSPTADEFHAESDNLCDDLNKYIFFSLNILIWNHYFFLIFTTADFVGGYFNFD